MSFRTQGVTFDPDRFVLRAGDTMTGSLLATNGAIDLGDATHAWRSIYLAASIVATSTLSIDNANAGDGIQIGTTTAAGVVIGRATKNVTINADALLANVTNAQDLGTGAAAWRTLYLGTSVRATGAFSLDATGATAISIANATASVLNLGRAGINVKVVGQAGDALMPTVNNVVDLGTSSIGWRTGYFSTSLRATAAFSLDAVGATAVSIADANASALNLGRAGIITTVLGTLRYDKTAAGPISVLSDIVEINVGGAVRYIQTYSG